MGGLLQLIDFSQGNMARKVVKHKRIVDGLEAPRNSLELPVETCQSYCDLGANKMFTYHEMDDWSEKKCCPNEASVKKLISEEISTRPKARHNAPSVVARLMGVDMLPSAKKPVQQQLNKKKENPGTIVPKEEWSKKVPVCHDTFASNSSRRTKSDPFHHVEDEVSDPWRGSFKTKKPRPREHPQDEELQKFKKEFEAWQAARFKECSKVVELGSLSSQLLAQESLNNEKLALYPNAHRKRMSEKPIESKNHIIKESFHERQGSLHNQHKSELISAEMKETSRGRIPHTDVGPSPMMNSDTKSYLSAAPTKIVILRPGPDRFSNIEDSWASSSGISDERGSIEDFLEEVKKRLKYEFQGKNVKHGMMVRGGGIETPYHEKPSDPKQIAQRIAKQVRDNVTRDLGMNLLRSESTRSYRSDVQFNGTGSPEFINKDTRRYVSERLRNIVNVEKPLDIPLVVHGSLKTSMLDNARGRLQQSGNKLNAGNKMSGWGNVKDEQDMQSRSFRCEPNDGIMPHKELSPRNLIRSLSAPVSGTSFGKLLLEDRHILTGGHIRRRHEAIEKITVNVKKGKKEKFNIREKVSSFKYSFTLKGRLFGRKFESAEESHSYGQDLVKSIMSGPTVVMNFNDRYENSTEVPPSPASVCSSVHEEMWWQAEVFSSTSSSEVPQLEDSAMPEVFKEISSNLIELRKQLNQLGTSGYEETIEEEQPLEVEEVELEDKLEAYIRDLLVASGLYDGTSGISLSRWDPLTKPISEQVFEEVEESYKGLAKDSEDSEGDMNLDHKVLLDLLNETLSNVLGPPAAVSKFRNKFMGPLLRPPCGRELLDHVWEMMRVYVYPPKDTSYYSLEAMVARELHSAPRSGLMDDDVKALGKELESQIMAGLIDEIVRDVQS